MEKNDATQPVLFGDSQASMMACKAIAKSCSKAVPSSWHEVRSILSQQRYRGSLLEWIQEHRDDEAKAFEKKTGKPKPWIADADGRILFDPRVQKRTYKEYDI